MNHTQPSTQRWLTLFAALLIVAGIGTIGMTIASNLIGLSAWTGFGTNKIFLAIIGALGLVSGIVLLTPPGKTFLAYAIVQSMEKTEWRVSSIDLILLAIGVGFATGILEVGGWFVLKFVMRHVDPTFSSGSDVVWMAPLMDAAIFAVLGLALALINRVWRNVISLPVAIFIFVFLGLYGLADFIAPWLQVYARLVLVVGLSFQLARMVADRPQIFYRFFNPLTFRAGRRGSVSDHDEARFLGAQSAPRNDNLGLIDRRQFLVSTGVVAATLATGVRGWREWIEWNALTNLPSPPRGTLNIVLIVMDTVRAQNLSAYGYARATSPNLERLAKSSVRFERAISTAPWTLPSHAGIFTGHWHHEVSADWFKPLDATFPTLAQILSGQGYLTAGFAANLDFDTQAYGLNRGFIHYEDFPTSIGQAVLNSSLGRAVSNNSRVRRLIGNPDVLNRKTASDVTGDFINWLTRQGRRPFFAFLNYYDAHQPYLPPAPFDSKFSPQRASADFSYATNDAERTDMWRLAPQEIDAERAAYDGAIAYLDHNLGLVVDALQQRGELENTLLIVTSDHGEQLGEHGLFGHTNSLYIQTLHVPLLIALPSKLPAGTSVTTPVTLRDIPATVMDVIGMTNAFQFPGASLARHWQNDSTNEPSVLLSEINGGGFSAQNWYPVAKGSMRSVVADRYHYIQQADGKEELYDWFNDPAETNNLAEIEASHSILQQLRSSLTAFFS